jgi:hypothetical protein
MVGLLVCTEILTFSIFLPLSTANRENVVRSFNPQRNGSSPFIVTPLQIGNGNFAFNADITGLQTLQPFNTLSSWGWHNSSLPTIRGQTSPSNFTGQKWWTHGRLVEYEQPNSIEPELSQWLIRNPHRLNLARIGILYQNQRIQQSDLSATYQELDLFTGILYSNYTLFGADVSVETVCDPTSDTVAFKIKSEHVRNGILGVFISFPYATDKLKFEAPFVGIWDQPGNHHTVASRSPGSSKILHQLDSTKYNTHMKWSGEANLNGPLPRSHLYTLQWDPQNTSSLAVSFHFSIQSKPNSEGFEDIKQSSKAFWREYWKTGAFVDCTRTPDKKAIELQRRIILSQYLLAVNSAGDDPPQESGLVNNGWYGKFHLEMSFWHLAHWAHWGKWSRYHKSLPAVYARFLSSSVERAKKQGYQGARWGKMSDPSGRSAPGQINSLLLWQQPHPFYFAEMDYRAFPTSATLAKWDHILTESANFMASYAFWNASTQVYDLGPPMYPVSENTNPNQTINPTFELAYWKLGLDIAIKWRRRQNKREEPLWVTVADNLASLPIQNDTYVLYEGVKDMWNTPKLTSDHPALLGINGWLPVQRFHNSTVFQNTVSKVYATWNLTKGYGWDFPLLAMTAIRTGDTNTAIEMLLHESFQFDDVGMPLGGLRVKTPYFPSSGGLLLAVALMAGGWDGSAGPHFPKEWNCNVNGFTPAM